MVAVAALVDLLKSPTCIELSKGEVVLQSLKKLRVISNEFVLTYLTVISPPTIWLAYD